MTFFSLLERIAKFMAFLSSIASIFIFVGVNNISEILRNKSVDIDISVDNKYELSKSLLVLNGYIKPLDSNDSINMVLRDADLEVFCLCKIDGDGSKWEVKASPIIDHKGDIKAVIDVSKIRGMCNKLLVVMIVCPKYTIFVGDEVANITPYYKDVSNLIKVKIN